MTTVKHKHEPEVHGWHTDSPNGTWLAWCKAGGHAIMLVDRNGKQHWRAVPLIKSAPRGVGLDGTPL